MRPTLQKLRPYPFERLRALFADLRPAAGLGEIRLSIGEPKQPPPHFVLEALTRNLPSLATYPTTQGTPELRQALAAWATRRFGLPPASLSPDRHVLPVNGTREALFAIAQALLEPGQGSVVVMPNPCYQIYEGAALLAGAEPYYVAAGPDGMPEWAVVPDAIWARCRLLYICTPDNPSGAVASREWLKELIALADRYNFTIVSDECYSELYPSQGPAPAGILQAAAELGRLDFKRCLAFHSLSKRSNLPGLRSGFVAGDADLLKDFLLYRTYHGAAMSPAVQAASVVAWGDEAHVIANRRHYDQAYAVFLSTLPNGMAARPAGSFYVWLRTPGDDQTFAKRLYAEQNVIVLPGSLLGRDVGGVNPGSGYVRVSLVEAIDVCAEAGRRIAKML